MNNKQLRIKALTWKYFWEQKIDEIAEHFVELIVYSFIIAVMLIPTGTMLEENGYPGIILIAIGCSLILFWILVGITFILMDFQDWVTSNWKKAKRRAVKDIKNERKR